MQEWSPSNIKMTNIESFGHPAGLFLDLYPTKGSIKDVILHGPPLTLNIYTDACIV